VCAADTRSVCDRSRMSIQQPGWGCRILHCLFVSPALSDVAKSARLFNLILCLFVFVLLSISPRPPSRASLDLPGRRLAAIEKLSSCFLNSLVVGGGSEMPISLRNKLQKMQHSSKNIYLSRKKLSDFGWIISLPNAENRDKICQHSAEVLWCIRCICWTRRRSTHNIAMGQC